MNAPQLQPPQKCGFSTIHHKHVLGQLIQPQLHETNPRIQNRKCCHGHKQKKDTTPQQPLHRPRLRRWPDRKGVSEPSSSFRIGKYDENPWGPDESLPNMYRVFDKYLCCSYLSNFCFTGSCPIWWKKGMILSNSGCKCKHWFIISGGQSLTITLLAVKTFRNS